VLKKLTLKQQLHYPPVITEKTAAETNSGTAFCLILIQKKSCMDLIAGIFRGQVCDGGRGEGGRHEKRGTACMLSPLVRSEWSGKRDSKAAF